MFADRSVEGCFFASREWPLGTRQVHQAQGWFSGLELRIAAGKAVPAGLAARGVASEDRSPSAERQAGLPW